MPVTYFYPVYFAVLLVHRQLRDDRKCRAKCAAVPPPLPRGCNCSLSMHSSLRAGMAKTGTGTASACPRASCHLCTDGSSAAHGCIAGGQRPGVTCACARTRTYTTDALTGTAQWMLQRRAIILGARMLRHSAEPPKCSAHRRTHLMLPAPIRITELQNYRMHYRYGRWTSLRRHRCRAKAYPRPNKNTEIFWTMAHSYVSGHWTCARAKFLERARTSAAGQIGCQGQIGC